MTVIHRWTLRSRPFLVPAAALSSDPLNVRVTPRNTARSWHIPAFFRPAKHPTETSPTVCRHVSPGVTSSHFFNVPVLIDSVGAPSSRRLVEHSTGPVSMRRSISAKSSSETPPDRASKGFPNSESRSFYASSSSPHCTSVMSCYIPEGGTSPESSVTVHVDEALLLCRS